MNSFGSRARPGSRIGWSRPGAPFPDVVVEASDGREVVELVPLVGVYQPGKQLLRSLQASNLELCGLNGHGTPGEITLQPHHGHVEKNHPIEFPNLDGIEGRQLVADFTSLLKDRFDDLSTGDGGRDGHASFDKLRNTDGTLCFPTLSKYSTAYCSTI